MILRVLGRRTWRLLQKEAGMDPKDQTRRDANRTRDTPDHSPGGDRIKDLRKANENIRKSPEDDIGRTGNKPAFDRDR
jgi:hypothetical protein